MIVRAYIFLIMACILWSFNPVANKIALVEIAVPQLVFMRAFLSAIILLTVTFCLGHSFRLKQIGWRPFLLGVLDPGLTSLLFVTSLTLVSISNTVLVMALMPFSQPILARLVLKEEVQSSIWFGAVLVLFGLSLFFLGEQIINKDSLLGNVLLLTIFGLFTFSQLLTRKIMLTEISTFVVTSSQMVSATVFMFFNLIIFGNLELPFQASSGTIMTFVYLVFFTGYSFLPIQPGNAPYSSGDVQFVSRIGYPLRIFVGSNFHGRRDHLAQDNRRCLGYDRSCITTSSADRN